MDQRPTPRPRLLREGPGLAGAVPSDCPVTICGVTLDSRAVRPRDLYAALPGARTHGARYAAQAVERGAAAILTDPAGAAMLPGQPVVVATVPDPRAILGDLAAWVYGDPGSHLLLIGVTGTNGKTTMTYLLAAGLARAGHLPGVIGTIGIRVGDDDVPSAHTTPEAPDLHATLAVMVERGVTAVAMEVSSHALALNRVDGLRFEVAVFTNLSQDHLDFHGGMAQYFASKAKLFQPGRARRGVVCIDDAWGGRLLAEAAVPVTSYGIDPAAEAADWTLTRVAAELDGSWRGTARGPGGVSVGLSSPLPGRFNRANLLGSLAALVSAGLDAKTAADGLAACRGVPGRMQPVGSAEYAAFVDYAHTPEAVGRAIDAVRQFVAGRVLVVLGCGGDRDAGKRPQMGRVAASGADLVVVTDDNPRSEDPAVIRTAVLAGARAAGAAEVVEIGDRRAAIAHAVARATRGDVVLVLGKGHERGQEVAGVVTPFDDREVLAEVMAQRAGERS